MQERPEDVPTGELPRNMTLLVDRHLVGKIAPGTRVTAIGIYSIYQVKVFTFQNLPVAVPVQVCMPGACESTSPLYASRILLCLVLRHHSKIPHRCWTCLLRLGRPYT